MLKDSCKIQGDSLEDSGSIRKGYTPYKWQMLDKSEHYHIWGHQFGKLSVEASFLMLQY